MAKIIIERFGGISPATPPRYLDNAQSQVAENCANWNGSLEPMLGLLDDGGAYFAEDYFDADYFEDGSTTLLPSPDANTIYLFGSQISERKWFQWDTDVDVVRGFISGDTEERTFFTGDGVPQATDEALNPGVEPFPNASYDLGLPAPTVAPSCAVIGTPTANAVPETRVYTYTWVNSWGDESVPYSLDPMPAGAFANVSDGETVNVTLPTSVAGNIDVTLKRLYRSVAGSGGTVEYLFVAEIAIATAVYNDAVDADDLGEVMPSTFWLPPPDDLAGLVGMSNGVMSGFVGRDVYFSDPYHPYAWPIAYRYTLQGGIVGLGVTDLTVCALTDGKPVFLQGSHPDSMTPTEVDVHQACVSKRSIVSMLGAVFYASPDGLVKVSPSGSSLVTEGMFEQEDWAKLEPSTIHAYSHENRYVAFYQSSVYGNGGFVIDFDEGVFVQHDQYVEAGYTSLEDDTLFLAQSNYIKSWDAGDALTYIWRSKKFTVNNERSFSAIRIDTEGAGVTCRVYRDDVKILDKLLTSRKIQRLPSGKGKDWEIELEGTDEVFRVGMAESAEELGDA